MHTPKGDCMQHLYICRFTGRVIGAMGITHPVREMIKTESDSDVVRQLYSKYEHIHNLVITKMDE